METILKIAAFSEGKKGGNPAGVWIGDVLPDTPIMQQAAADVGFSETVFAAPNDGKWRARYFSPESEVPFCGHATIALGAALALKRGDGLFTLLTDAGQITVEGKKQDALYAAALQSPPTKSQPVSETLLNDALTLFGYSHDDLNHSLPPALIHAGANHLVLSLNSRERLKEMRYDLRAGKELMNAASLVTILLLYSETPHLFHTRNSFASGGVYEDPATGAATAALAGYLRDLNWPHDGAITIIQGEDMGCRSILHASISPTKGSSIRISGTARLIEKTENTMTTRPNAYTENLFSYGTLRYENVQLTTFGRKLTGQEDKLPDYCLKTVKITDPDVIAKSGEDLHSIIHFSGNPQDQIPGMVFEISREELAQADKYEVADYKRIRVNLLSGISAWVYVSTNNP